MIRWKVLGALALVFTLVFIAAKDIRSAELKEGDIVFQTSLSAQSKAIQLATKSKYSHMGIISKETSKDYVYEAAQVVKLTPLEVWIQRGEGNHYVVKRLKNA